jgi:hypothetical protein
VTCIPAFCVATARTERVLSYTGGRWSQLASIQPPATAGADALRGDTLGHERIACFAGGHCVAVGTFTDSQGRGSFLVSTRA